VSFKEAGFLAWVADPGKIWALHRRLFDGTRAPHQLRLASIPQCDGRQIMSPNAAIPVKCRCAPIRGGMHNVDHIDYSCQILLLVARGAWRLLQRWDQDRMVPMHCSGVYRVRGWPR
jgi:hypothetical protein